MAGLMLLAGCVSDSEPQQTVRTSVQTAPADLQLLCASEAASTAGVESDKVLPISSRQLDGSNYQVDLNVDGSSMSCIVDNEGVVQSVQPS